MFFSAIVLVASVIPATLVTAQSGTNDISPCLLSCVTDAATSAGCSSFTDVQCVCTSTEFQDTAILCLQSDCPRADLQDGQALLQQQCGDDSGSTSLTDSAESTASSSPSPVRSTTSSSDSSVTSRLSSTSSSLPSATSATSSAASASSSSAGGSMTSFASGSLFSVVVIVVGLALGRVVV